MHIMYVDEAGDPGYDERASPRYVRVGVIVHGFRWRSVDVAVEQFKLKWGLKWSDELKASHIRRGREAFNRPESARDTLMKSLLDLIGQSEALTMLGVSVNKRLVDTERKERLSNPAVRTHEMLLEMYSEYLTRQPDRCGIVVVDENEARNDRNLRRFQNYLRNYSDRVDDRRIVEGTMFLASNTCNLLQVADVCSNVYFRSFLGNELVLGEWRRICRRFEATRDWPEWKIK